MTVTDLPARAAGLEQSLPSSWYSTERIFAIEKERLFCREWFCVGREEELPAPGAHRVLDVLGESILLVRNRSGQLRAFYNVCRHRGARLCRAPAEAGAAQPLLSGGVVAGRTITCPYHRWTYDLDGQLLGAPHLTVESFDKSAFSLYPVGVEVWGGFIFVHLTPARAGVLYEQIGAIDARIQRYPLASLRIGHTIEYQVRANWKVICENYNECYHCAGVHPELCAVVPAFRQHGGAKLDWVRGIPHREGAYTFTKTGTATRRAFPALNEEERVRHKGELVYPNLFLSLACEHVAAFILRPRGAARTDITCHFLFEPEEIAKPAFDHSDASEFWDLVNRQDWAICETVQQGIESRVHTHGYYAPMEDFNLDIRRYVMDRIGDAVDTP
ncbi:MAG TPA: aromatic ring-hydroxylating dioxygenase subunit alpha [Steroidobacteraceae bacterium]|nr:aromatic ring-hydroxylating dioxygenase subunit alpha [Steroidobacteraceae bacterium]